ncbi:elongation factor G Fus [Thermosynechococcus sp. NK55a]|uniref:elongation factor G n=1 Tax=unclassified Thermosynechococcus TaxID=2622553 RepID=UPI0003D7CFBF|nr:MULTISPECIES: elongation factor G [unclassified Thermosynechococcus]AHB89030.1 elongation factor G Fus [Thermosynechococcus sp. NK55a]RMH67652.1 MAG: elongation factor G [Cyanobacteria bacterium J003]HIK23012.1 elongation factor G [Thermosynechococcus sp. M3746_W2019_013]
MARRCNIALVGNYNSGKTTLAESILRLTRATNGKASSLLDTSPEARDRQMGVELNVVHTQYGELDLTLLDCPGSVELLQETLNALVGVDMAIVVCEPLSDRAFTLTPLFKFLDDWQIPHILFVNKMERAHDPYMEILAAYRQVSSRPLVPHQYPIWQGDDLLGYIDLVTEQAYHYHAGAAADLVPFPSELQAVEQAARAELLEALANYDDHLLEELLEDIAPPESEIMADLRWELGADLIVPVFFGSAQTDDGVRPLLAALDREAPDATATAAHRQINGEEPLAQVLKTFYVPQGGGKLSLVRVWQGTLTDGMSLNGVRVGGIYRAQGTQLESLGQATAGEVVLLARLEGIRTGETLSGSGQVPPLPCAPQLEPVYALAMTPSKRSDEVKLTGALQKLLEEDPALHWEQHGDTHEMILWGQGEIHLQIALDRLRRKYNLPMQTHLPQVPYRETIRRSIKNSHGRYKHQTGGHGQFGDVYLDIAPLERGSGFQFSETIVGGVVPKQYIPGVEQGVREFLNQGPLGFPIVDVAVTLTNGSYHSVDSSEQAFRQAARLAMQAGIPQCEPQLLEPIMAVQVWMPQAFTAKVMQALTGRRGQVLGYSCKEGWPGWEQIEAYLPQAEMHDFVVELRSLTMGTGGFHWQFDHLQEVPEKLAAMIVQRHKNA